MSGTYYRVLTHGRLGRWYKVQVWRWWFPFWITSRDYIEEEWQAAEFIRLHSTYYDGAE